MWGLFFYHIHNEENLQTYGKLGHFKIWLIFTVNFNFKDIFLFFPNVNAVCKLVLLNF